MGLTNSGVGVDVNLAQRVRLALESFDVTERRMFGGICFMIGGRTISSFVRVAGAGVANKRNLQSWLNPAAKIASTRPAKQKAGKSTKENFSDNIR